MDPAASAPLVFDDMAIDLAGHRLLRDGIEQPLEPKAFGVLALLVGSPGQVFARDEILDAVWGHRHVTPGVLNRVMTLLRHALGEDAHGARYLHTVHGVGYRFDLPREAPAASALQAPAVEPDPPSPPSRSLGRRASDRPGARMRAALWVLPLLAVLAVVGWKLWPRPAAPDVAPIAVAERSIAVLPLANASGNADQQFFSDGLSENLIDTLSRFEGLKVIGRASSFRFRDSSDDSKTIGAALGVAYLVSGSVQRAGDIVRIGVEVTSTTDGRTIWTEHYDRPYRDLFALQDEIARAIASALQARLLPPESAPKQDDHPPGGDIEAYNAYLHGMQNFYRENMRKAVEYQTEATRLDPRYAAAWAQLSVAWALIGYSQTGAEARASYRNSRAAVDRALALAPDLGIAHGALGNLLLAQFDWQGAIAELRRGTRLEPDGGQNHGGLSRALAASGHLRDAIAERQRFLSMDPLQAFNYFNYAELLIASGRLDEAEENLRIGEQLASRPTPAHQRLYVAILRGDTTTARSVAARQAPPWREMNLALAAQLGTDRAAADAALAGVLGNGTWAETSPYLVAQAYALRGDADKAVEWLERTWSWGDTNLHHLLYDPLLLRFRDDPRLIAFCARVGLPSPDSSEALSIDQIREMIADKR